jgi:TetR/AcrR family transcriptional regulator, transcriptional repressor for nem operon
MPCGYIRGVAIALKVEICTTQPTSKRRPKDRIVEAARQLFWERGYYATTLVQIGDRAHVTGGSLYYFFRSKEQLLLAVLDRHTAMLLPVLVEPTMKSTDDPVERVFTVLRGYREGLLRTDFHGSFPVGNLALEVSGSLPRARDKIEFYFRYWRSCIETLLSKAGGSLAPGSDSGSTSALILAVLEGAALQVRASLSIEPFDSAVFALQDYFRCVPTEKRGAPN